MGRPSATWFFVFVSAAFAWAHGEDHAEGDSEADANGQIAERNTQPGAERDSDGKPRGFDEAVGFFTAVYSGNLAPRGWFLNQIDVFTGDDAHRAPLQGVHRAGHPGEFG